MFLKLMKTFIFLLTILAIQVNSQSSLFNLFESGGAEHGGEGGSNIHTLFKFGSPSYNGISEQSASHASNNAIQNPYYFQQQQPPQQIYRYPQNYYYPQQYYGK
uniref:Uncharacterized protein n=1 Tax=Panagrolaimus sp. PS1159 TaxID=55785 RepID=A0AC35G3Z5_9BILA